MGANNEYHLTIVRELLRDRTLTNPLRVLERASERSGIESSIVIGKSRTHPVKSIRQSVAYVLRIRFGLPYETIGAHLGGRDHSTMMHAVKRIGEELGEESEREKVVIAPLETIALQNGDGRIEFQSRGAYDNITRILDEIEDHQPHDVGFLRRELMIQIDAVGSTTYAITDHHTLGIRRYVFEPKER